ncbi:MAG: hypothetical protein M0C28_29345 [Candidatus Moduliflexus flocculans]|nr:hypothetical protein [Candidatus Moduliflexus flocculans]
MKGPTSRRGSLQKGARGTPRADRTDRLPHARIPGGERIWRGLPTPEADT